MCFSYGQNVEINGTFVRCIPFRIGIQIGRYYIGNHSYHDLIGIIETIKWADENRKLIKNA